MHDIRCLPFENDRIDLEDPLNKTKLGKISKQIIYSAMAWRILGILCIGGEI